MKLEIIAVESLGVRGLCCCVRTKDRTILIDPGIALGYTRDGLLPHPFQVAVGERIRGTIVRRWARATDIVISHFHGDHVPLANANPYQLSADAVAGLNPSVRLWAKNPQDRSPLEEKRAEQLTGLLETTLIPAESKTSGGLSFSGAVPHGRKYGNRQSVMMTRIEDEGFVFVHASDIQLLCDEPVSLILSWKPDIVLAGGPPLYLGRRVPAGLLEQARGNARRLARGVDTLILDHHLLRSRNGTDWLNEIAAETGKTVICGADFMNTPRLLLEASRERLYRNMPVPPGWHEAYARGDATTAPYWGGYS